MYDITNLPTSVEIGLTGEHAFRTIEIDMSKWMAIMPNGVPSIVHIRPGEGDEDAYIVATTFDSDTNVLSWTVSRSDLGTAEGVGTAQVWLEETANYTLAKRGLSAMFATIIRDSIGNDSATVPAAQVPFVQQMTLLKTNTVAAALRAEAAQAAAESAASGVSEYVSQAEQHAQSADNYAEISEAYAKGTVDGVAVDEGETGYHDNSKYYKEQAANSATVAAGSATTASQQALAAGNSMSQAYQYSQAAATSAQNAATSATNSLESAAVAEAAKGVAQTKASEAAASAAQAAQTVAGIEAAGDAEVLKVTAQGAAERAAIVAEGEDVLDSIPADYTALTEEVGNLSSAIDYALSDSFVGSEIDFNNAESGVSCRVSSDTSNKVYRTGKNLYWCNTTGRTNNGITFAVDSTTKKTTVSGTATGSAFLLPNSLAVWFYLPAGTYTLSGGSSKCKLQAKWYDANGNVQGSALVDDTTPATFTMAVGALAKVDTFVANGTSFATSEVISPMLVKGSVAAIVWEKPDRAEITLTADNYGSIKLVNGLNHLFSESEAEYVYIVPITEIEERVDTLEEDMGNLNYQSLSGIKMTIGCPYQVSDDDAVIYYDETVINYRIGTPEVHQYSENITFTPSSGYRIYFWEKGTGESSYTVSGWKTTAYTVPANTKWAMEVARSPEDATQPADLDTFVNAVSTSVPLATLKSKISDIESHIKTIDKAINPLEINAKYADRTDALAQLTRLPMFLIFTDIHGFGQYLERIGAFYNANRKSSCKDVICLGDIVYNEFDDDFTFMSDSDFGKKVLLTIGNHDCYNGVSVGGVNAVDLYDKFFSNVALWDVVQPTGASTNGYCYYYKDYDNKIRLIVLNEYYWDSAQQTWFESVLASARTAGLAVIVAQHQGNFDEVEYSHLEDYAFGTKQYLFIRYTAGYTDRRNAVDSFVSDGGEFIGWINGHSHCEQFGTFSVNSRTQLSMTFSNAGQDSTSRVKIADYSQDCFYYLAVDTTNKWVYVLTIGQAENKWFHRNLMLMYNYQTHEIVEYY